MRFHFCSAFLKTLRRLTMASGDQAIPLLPKISTIAFIDLETTGLPRGGKQPQITEIGIIAIHRDEFLRSLLKMEENGSTQSESGQSQQMAIDGRPERINPRVISKLLQPIKPETSIHPVAANISGLSEPALSSMPVFSTAIPTIWAFLSSLPKPVCLIAHNGDSFDFPIIRSELARSQSGINMDGVFCADSIKIFKSIDRKFESKSKEGIPISRTSSMGKTEEEDLGDDSPSKRQRPVDPSITESSIDLDQSSSPAPITASKSDPFIVAPAVPQPLVTANSSPALLKSMAIGSYALKAMYDRIFGMDPPNHHSAEGDCLSIMHIAGQYGEDFLNEIDSLSKPFCQVD